MLFPRPYPTYFNKLPIVGNFFFFQEILYCLGYLPIFNIEESIEAET